MKINPDSACYRCVHFAVCKHVEHVYALIEKLPRDRRVQLESDDPCIHAGILYTAVANVCNAYAAGPRLKPGASLWPADLVEKEEP